MPRSGDAINCLVLANTAAFLGAVILHAFGHASLFSTSFLTEGFCVGFKETPLLQSHVLCFYVDSVCALILWALSRRSHAAKGFAPLASAALGVFGHGVAHLGIGAGWMASGTDPRPGLLRENVPVAHNVLAMAGMWLFFFALLRSAPNVPHSHAAFHALLHAPALCLLVPPRFGFTYVQTVLLLVACTYDLFSPAHKKDRYYDLAALLINLPVGMVAWVEALGCDSFFKSLGGHVWYDATIPLSMFVYYAVALGSAPVESAKPATKKAD